ncbi:MAG: thermonuclease family protein [Hyphomicrobiaceae bacterium]
MTFCSPASSQSAIDLNCGLEPGPRRAVSEVIDGDTLRLDDGKVIRLVGALAPRGRDAVGRINTSGHVPYSSWPPALAARAALLKLVGGQSVALAFAGRRVDRYDRVLAHLFVSEGTNTVWVQGRMLDTGHARAYALPDSDSCLAELVTREAAARKAGAGLWAHAAYQIRPADRPTELALFVNTFQLVRGQIAHARRSRRLTIVDLASSEGRPAGNDGRLRGAFRIVWTHTLARRAGLPRATDLIGRTVLVRGWITARRGPEITLIAAGDLAIDD